MRNNLIVEVKYQEERQTVLRLLYFGGCVGIATLLLFLIWQAPRLNMTNIIT